MVSNEIATVTELTGAYRCYQHMGARTMHDPVSLALTQLAHDGRLTQRIHVDESARSTEDFE